MKPDNAPCLTRTRILHAAVVYLVATCLGGCAGLRPTVAALPAACPVGESAPAVGIVDASARQTPTGRHDAGDVDLSFGLGLTTSPDTLLIPVQADYYLNEDLAIGPMVQIGLDDDDTILATSLNFKHPFYLSPGEHPELRPFIQGGVGVAYIEKERRPGDDDEAGLLLNVGGGLELRLDESMFLSTGLMINFLPSDLEGEDTFLSWQILQVGWKF